MAERFGKNGGGGDESGDDDDDDKFPPVSFDILGPLKARILVKCNCVRYVVLLQASMHSTFV